MSYNPVFPPSATELEFIVEQNRVRVLIMPDETTPPGTYHVSIKGQEAYLGVVREETISFEVI